MSFEQTNRNTVHRIPDRGYYDEATIYGILDAGYVCHVGFVTRDQPFVIPTIYGRRDGDIYLHGAAASRLMKRVGAGIDACLTVTHVDGLVLARSAFHHSLNYRSVVVFGTATEVNGQEKFQGLRVITENVLAGRWSEVRGPSEMELNATSVIRFTIESASAKVRTGPPKDEAEDYDLPIWAGVLPISTSYGVLQPDRDLKADMEPPQSLLSLLERER